MATPKWVEECDMELKKATEIYIAHLKGAINHLDDCKIWAIRSGHTWEQACEKYDPRIEKLEEELKENTKIYNEMWGE